MAIRTRRLDNSILGYPAPLPLRQLPTDRNVHNAYQFVRKTLTTLNTESRSYLASVVAKDIVQIYDRAGIPSIAETSIRNKIIRMLKKTDTFLKTPLENEQQLNF